MSAILNKRLNKGNGISANCCSMIVAAAGSSTRMDGVNKILTELLGEPVIVRTLTALSGCPEVAEIIVVTAEDSMSEITALIKAFNISKVSAVVQGGASRLESVMCGVSAVSPKAMLIGIHDGARPFVTADLISIAVDAALKHNAAAPAIPITSTVKLAHQGFVTKTMDRAVLYEVQTPQIFATELIKGALQNALDKQLPITDDCMAVEALGCPVKLTAGARDNIKLTTAIDLAFAETIIQMRRKSDENRTWL